MVSKLCVLVSTLRGCGDLVGERAHPIVPGEVAFALPPPASRPNGRHMIWRGLVIVDNQDTGSARPSDYTASEGPARQDVGDGAGDRIPDKSELEIAQPQVDMADRHTDQHQAEGVLGKGSKAEIDAVAFGDPGHRQVRRSADQGAVAAEQAPSDKAHHSGITCSAPPRCGAISRISGIIAATNGILSTIADKMAEPHRITTAVAAGSSPVSRIRRCAARSSTPATSMPWTMTNSPMKEENRDPIDLVECLGDPDRLFFALAVMFEIVQQHQDRGAEQRDRAGLQVERPGEDEGRDDTAR